MKKFPIPFTMQSASTGKPVQVYVRRGTGKDWLKHNPILLDGEIGLNVKNGMIKIGDGKKNWTNLKYFKLVKVT